MNSVYNEQILSDKLSKLNSRQQCIETLSHWCIFHRSKAQLVVETWGKKFHSSHMAQKVPLLYLANDILQNSKRKGNEFVAEFWKALPAALKDISENGDDSGKNVVSRLIKIWEERRVFGSRARRLREVMMGGGAPPPLELSKKCSRSVRILKRDSRSIRTKLSIGGTAEKIVSAFHMVLSEHANEEAEMNNCKSAVHRVRKMEEHFDSACSNTNDPRRESLAKELEDEENILKQCMEKLKSVEASRQALVSQLKEALHEQESELENIQTQIQVAQAQAVEASNMRKRLNNDYVAKASPTADMKGGQTPKRSAASMAAEMVEKLTASSSSQMIMHSVLSTFAAEEAKSVGLSTSNPVTNLSNVGPTQAQYLVLPNQPQSQQFQQLYGYGSVAPLLAPPHMVSPMVPLTPQHQPMVPQQPISMTQPQTQPSAPASFQPLQPPGTVYYGHPHS
ncbi:uncharacterized protein [Rutidosis leptorrhynchoides]|uniref:uncharacterized protein n=1 Tax=Rutidosis leptorrhynchoides TaxID=125765 RepID=UPI003A9A2998